MDKDEIYKILNTDPLLEAEKMTGESYKTSKDTVMLGMYNNMLLGNMKREMLSAIGDTTFSMKTEDYMSVVQKLGFELVYKTDFEGDYALESQYVLYHNEYGILLNFDTFCGNRNGGNIYYNFLIPAKVPSGKLTSSGGFHSWREDPRKHGKELNYFYDSSGNSMHVPFEDVSWDIENGEKYEHFAVREKEYVDNILKPWIDANSPYRLWVGHHDCREALCFNINNIAESCIFVKKWHAKPFLWLLNHKSGDDYETVNNRVIESLPEHVRNNINGI